MTRDTRSNASARNANDDIRQLIYEMKADIVATIDRRLNEVVDKIKLIASKVESLERSMSSLQIIQKKHKDQIEGMTKEINVIRNECVGEAVAEVQRREEKRYNTTLFFSESRSYHLEV